MIKDGKNDFVGLRALTQPTGDRTILKIIRVLY